MNTRSLRGAARRNKTRRRSKKGKNTEYKSKNIIKKGIAGYGVFAGKGYNKGEIIETCPFIQIGKEHLQEINGKRNPLRDYVFTSHLKKDHELIVFGNGSLFNHSDNPNVTYYHDKTRNRLLYYAASKKINRGEELFIFYGKNHSVTIDPDTNTVGSTY